MRTNRAISARVASKYLTKKYFKTSSWEENLFEKHPIMKLLAPKSVRILSNLVEKSFKLYASILKSFLMKIHSYPNAQVG